MTAQQLAALLDQPLEKIEKALASLRAKGLVETRKQEIVNKPRYELGNSDGTVVITKDGHTMFLEDVVKDLNRVEWLEQKLEATNELLSKACKPGTDQHDLDTAVHENQPR